MIKVKKKRRDKEWVFEDLEMFHGECYGGKIVFKEKLIDLVVLKCLRCEQEISLFPEERMEIILTVVDGQERRFFRESEFLKKFKS